MNVTIPPSYYREIMIYKTSTSKVLRNCERMVLEYGNMLSNNIYPMILVVNQYILLESSMLSELKMSGK